LRARSRKHGLTARISRSVRPIATERGAKQCRI
jgi:hypothetical protein